MKIVAFVLLGAVVTVFAAVGIGSRVWDGDTQRIVDRLHEDGEPVSSAPHMESLPGPVARCFEHVFADGPPRVRSIRMTQTGEFRMGEDENSWRPFSATQHVDLIRPGFVWDARIEMAPLTSVRVRDAYVDGRGTMLGKVLSLVTVVDAHDDEELASGALLRYLAEAAWFPMVLTPSSSLRWRAIDDESAEAVLSDAGHEVAATFRFDDAGDIVGVSAQRYREVDGEYELTPWRGRFWNHAVRNGVRIPLEGEVAWMLPEGEYPYWRGTIVEYALD